MWGMTEAMALDRSWVWVLLDVFNVLTLFPEGKRGTRAGPGWVWSLHTDGMISLGELCLQCWKQVCHVINLSVLGPLFHCLTLCTLTSASSSSLCLCAAVESDQFLSSWGRFLYDALTLCERIAATLLTVVNSCIFTQDPTDGQSVLRTRSCPSKTTWNPWLTIISVVDQELRSFPRFLKVPVEVATNTCAGCTADGDGLSWLNRLRSRRLSQNDVSWWLWKTTKEEESI